MTLGLAGSMLKGKEERLELRRFLQRLHDALKLNDLKPY